MLVELAVGDLGVIDALRLLFSPGMTALTGETGAGKTMLVEAIELLVGGRADAMLVRPGATEATVEGRFVDDDDEIVLTRVVPADGRSRAYVNGRLAPVSATQMSPAGVTTMPSGECSPPIVFVTAPVASESSTTRLCPVSAT